MTGLTDDPLGRIGERGPRWAVSANRRRGEHLVDFFPDSTSAELAASTLRNSGYYNIQLYPPQGSVDLTDIGRHLAALRAALADQTDIAGQRLCERSRKASPSPPSPASWEWRRRRSASGRKSDRVRHATGP